MPVNPCDCNCKICYRVTNGDTSDWVCVPHNFSHFAIKIYVIENVCPLLLIPRTANVFKRFYYCAIRSESL